MPCHEHQVPFVDHDPFRLSPVSSTRFLVSPFSTVVWDTNPVHTPRSVSCCPQAHEVPGHIQEAFLDPWHLCAIAYPSGMSQLCNKKKKFFFFFQDSQHPRKHFSTSGAQLFFPVTAAPTWFRSLWCYNYLGVFICQGKECLQGQDPGLIHSLSFPLTSNTDSDLRKCQETPNDADEHLMLCPGVKGSRVHRGPEGRVAYTWAQHSQLTVSWQLLAA